MMMRGAKGVEGAMEATGVMVSIVSIRITSMWGHREERWNRKTSST